MKAMLFAAGLGTRLKPFTDNSPKALAVVNGKTLLEHNIHYLQKWGITEVIVNIHHFPDQVKAAVATSHGFGSNISFSDETEQLLETGGGLQKAADFFKEETVFVVMNVDILTNLNLSKLIQYHGETKAIGTLAVMKRQSSRELLFDNKMVLCGWKNNGTGEVRTARETDSASGFAFSGIQVLSPAIFQESPFSGKFSLIDLYLHLAKIQKIVGYDHTGDLVIDVGKPGSIEAAEKMFSET